MKDWQKELYFYRVTPAPPKKNDLQEYIDLYLESGDETYFTWFMHYYEPTLNTTAMGIVQRYALFGHFADIKESCVIGLWKALGSYSPEKGIPFLTYKTRIMWKEVHDYVRQMRSGLTVESREAYAKLRKIMALYNKRGETPDDEIIPLIAQKIGLSEKRVREMIEGGRRNLSLVDLFKSYGDEDAESSREDVTSDLTFEPEREFFHALRHDELFAAFGKLTYRELAVVRAHLGFCEECHSTRGEKNRPQTFYEIAVDHQLSSAEAAENIYKKALKKMKKRLEKADI